MTDIVKEFEALKARLEVALAGDDVLISLLTKLKEIGELMSAEVDKLRAEVEENKTVVASAIALITGLADRVRAVAGDAAATNALADELSANSDALGAAVAANTGV